MSTTTAPPNTAQARLEKELDNLRQHPIDGCSTQPDSSNPFTWTATLRGPDPSPYAGGIYSLTLSFPQDYPLKPPTVTFATKIYHPNIDSSSGFVGLNILHDAWTPALTVAQILLSLLAFLVSPDTQDAVVPEIAHELETKRDVYEATARQWTEKYAKGVV
ncbi:Nn.00g024170.m01.CDS01 [Neocucurbitaria sp. VM-36]